MSIAAGGMILPFVLGLVLAWQSHAFLAPNFSLLGYSLFLGIAMSVTAVPVLVRILKDLGAENLQLSRIVMLAAALTDVLAWLLLAVVTAIGTAQSYIATFFIQLALLCGYVALSWFVLRPVLGYVLKTAERFQGKFKFLTMAIMLIAALASGMATKEIGFHTAFGGIIMGLILSEHKALVAQWRAQVAGVINAVLVPLFFALAGCRAAFGELDSVQSALWFFAFLTIAVLGKYCGCYGAARFSGYNKKDSHIAGVLMNTRGLMELVVLTIGLDKGLIPVEVFSIMVFMTIVTTMMTVPLVRRWFGTMLTDAEAERKPTGGVKIDLQA